MALAVLFFVPGRYDAIASASIDLAAGTASDQLLGTQVISPGLVTLTQGNLTELVQSERVALDVVKRLRLTANPEVQAQFRESDSFGRETIDQWMANLILTNVDPTFVSGGVVSNVLRIKYKSHDPNQSALIANAFLAATIDATIAMKTGEAEQTARWFAPQIEELRKEFEAARTRLEEFQAKANLALPSGNAPDAEANGLQAIAQELSNSKATLAVLKSRLETGSANISTDPSDPDVALVSALKEKLTSAEAELEGAKTSLGANNLKMQIASSNVASLRRQLADATAKLKDHLRDRISQTENQIRSLETAEAETQKNLIAVQAQRDQLAELQRDAAFRLELLNERERVAEQAKLQSKLTFANIAVLDKADPPIAPAFPKPIIVIPVGIGGRLVLGLILALIAEMMDRRVRSPSDLEFVVSAPMLGIIWPSKRISRRRNRLLPA
ncbi:MAG: hypothetical protein JO347_12120 [Candidatus Eremiobacteraeota bacterium]|nr:hypothetical protein [Candidatus Eremiobacteraeota bacterium]